MKISLYKYSIPLVTSIRLNRGEMTIREGLIMKTSNKTAEISPLRMFSHENLDDIVKLFPIFCQLISNNTENFSTDVAKKIVLISPSLSFAYYQLTNTFENISRKEPYNFILGTPGEIISKLSDAKGLFKLKIGLYNQIEEIKLLQTLSQNNNLRIILDANCSLSRQNALKYISAVKNLEYFEDPCKNIEDLLWLAKKTKITFGLDELGQHLNNNLPQNYNLNNISYKRIYKPTIYGFPQFSENLILSSSFESIIGISYLEKLASFYNLPAPGTDTLKYFQPEYNNYDFFISHLEHLKDFYI